MKRTICFALVCLLLLGAAACGVAEKGALSGEMSDAAVSFGTASGTYVPTAVSANESEDDTTAVSANENEDDQTTPPSDELVLFADYAEEDEPEKDSPFYEEQGAVTLVKIWANRGLKNFKFITVADDGQYAGETLYELDALAVGQVFYAKTTIGEGYSERGFSFEDESGETVCYRIDYDGRGEGPMGFGLSRIPASPMA